MEPADLERTKKARARFDEMQDKCKEHKFTPMGQVTKSRFHADEHFGATCSLCVLRVRLPAWSRCPKCFNDLSEVEPSTVPGKFQGNGPVDDGQTHDYPTLEKQCACGITVWKYKGE